MTPEDINEAEGSNGTAACAVSRAEPCSPLTVEILKSLKFGLRMHLNGGDSYSARIDGNGDWGLQVETHTDGSPNYRILSKTLSMDGHPKIELNLMDKGRDFQAFCDAYNHVVNDHEQQPERSAPDA